jgi:hypothetical protein
MSASELRNPKSATDSRFARVRDFALPVHLTLLVLLAAF